MTPAERLKEIQSHIARAAESVGRDPGEVTLVAVSKTRPIEDLRALYDLGVRDFGESRLQEALPKIAALPGDVRWHFIGVLQSNKARKIAESFKEREFSAGETISTEGKSGAGFFVISSGTAKVTVQGEERGSLGPGEYFGEISVLDAQPRTASVTAGDGGLVTFAITSWAFSGLLEKHPGMSKQVIAHLCKRLRAVEAVAARSRAADVS